MTHHPAYVVLHHTGHGQEHFDLLLDLDGATPLLTWRLIRWPIEPGDRPALSSPHRRLYLEFEGAVPRNRGHVRRVAEGPLHITARQPTTLLVRLGPTDNRVHALPLTSE